MLHLTAIIIYFLLMVYVGALKTKKVKTQADFAVAGRSLTPWVLMGTMLATWIGTGSILGSAGETYKTGLAVAILPLSSVFGMILLIGIAGKVRNYEKFTVPEIIGARYNETTRLLSVIALTIAYMVIVSYQFNAGGKVLEMILVDDSGKAILSNQVATLIAAAFIIAYTMLAGLLSVAYTDVANGILMTVTLLVVLPVLWIKAGGWTGMAAAFEAMGKPDHMKIWGVYPKLTLVNYLLPTFLLVMGDANMYQRFSSGRDARGARKATILLVFGVLLIETLIVLNAWVSSSMIPDAANGKYVMIYAANQLMHPLLGAIMLVTIVGIIVSTADSFLLVPANCLIKDVYTNYINPKADEKKIVFLSRILVLLLGIVAYFVSLGFGKSETFFKRALYAYTIYGTSITPSLVAALFWKGATSKGAVSSIASGTVITIVWKAIADAQPEGSQSIFASLDPVLPAIGVSILCLIVVSIFTKKPRPPTP